MINSGRIETALAPGIGNRKPTRGTGIPVTLIVRVPESQHQVSPQRMVLLRPVIGMATLLAKVGLAIETSVCGVLAACDFGARRGKTWFCAGWFPILTLGLSCPLPAFAWGSVGHQVIANLAFAQLTPSARTQVDRLLSLEPGATLASLSTWADEHRNPATGPWHYINFPRDTCTYKARRDCPDGHCVVAVIERQQDVIGSSASNEKRLLALKYLVHFMGDVHQPLHAGYQEDRGGNSYQLQVFMRGSNLHALWDSGLIRQMNEPTEAMSVRLLKRKVQSDPAEMNTARMAEESCRIVGTPGFYPPRKVKMDYVEKFAPIMEQRLTIAGTRLAAALNRIWP